MDGFSHEIQPIQSSAKIRIGVIENREFLIGFLGNWLRNHLNYEVYFFNHFKELETSPLRPDLIMAASTLLAPSAGKRVVGPQRYLAIYSEQFTPSCVVCWQKNGADGLLDFRDGTLEWEQCLSRVLGGHKGATRFARLELERGELTAIGTLTPREIEVADHFLKGFSARQVSSLMGTTEGTIKNQRKAIYKKLGIVRATQLSHALGVQGVPEFRNTNGSATKHNHSP